MIRLYGREDCIWCKKAKELLEVRNIPFRYYIIDKDVSRSWLLEEFPYLKTVPIVIKDGLLIGGYEELVAWISKDVTLGSMLLVE